MCVCVCTPVVYRRCRFDRNGKKKKILGHVASTRNFVCIILFFFSVEEFSSGLLIYICVCLLFVISWSSLDLNSRARSCWNNWCVVCRLTTLYPIMSSWLAEPTCRAVTWPGDWPSANSGPSARAASPTSAQPSPVWFPKFRNCNFARSCFDSLLLTFCLLGTFFFCVLFTSTFPQLQLQRQTTAGRQSGAHGS